MSVELVAARCIVRPFVAADAPSIASAANDRSIWLQLRDRFPHPYHLSDAEVWIGRVGSLDPPEAFAIVVDGRAAGGVGLELMTDVNRRSAEIGYWLGTEFWGRGIATEAVALVSDWHSVRSASCECSPSHLPGTERPDEASRRQDMPWKGSPGAAQSKTARYSTSACMRA
ncbi:MAG TPA: GNAT family N-acetyltransferase [Steroidobacteraceae bacterium]|nr:GNAT family N-acetyltransferase [Steroidobacteraceae bacterium]